MSNTGAYIHIPSSTYILYITDICTGTHGRIHLLYASLSLSSGSMECPHMSEWMRKSKHRPEGRRVAGLTALDLSQKHTAERQEELSHEIVHNVSIIVVCRSTGCGNVTGIYTSWSCIEPHLLQDEPCSYRIWSSQEMGLLGRDDDTSEHEVPQRRNDSSEPRSVTGFCATLTDVWMEVSFFLFFFFITVSVAVKSFNTD